MNNEIKSKIEKYETIIIHRHVRPDPDAIGAQIGLKKAIQNQYPEKYVYAVGEEEESLRFLGEMDKVEDDMYEGAAVIVCDTANVERISDSRFKRGSYLIKIDHHPNEEPYGDIDWVDPTYSSTCEMIVEWMLQQNWEFDQEIAKLLYAGIVGDTGRFRFDNTTSDTLRRTSVLLEYPFDRNEFYSQLHKKDLRMLRLEGYILQNFKVIEGCVGAMYLTKDILKSFEVTSNESSQFVNLFSDVEGLKTWVFFVEEEDRIRVRLRSKGPTINDIAVDHHGGGHPKASGATAFSWDETDEILEKLIRVSRSS
ncbi:DHH family phosphoesterase [Halalkalibacter hemicellulosilyticus]|uniref:3'-to-5' oligoribonuclease A n=1 Tax=Halalkalibacter hemicellulosilyticusJCM 9152 TaxID=1236971 RepID=W4QFI9_9BACI|nr:bifunctional oligoribonuclease/PAP phosphatase NrnA [Halalkalibacter hemicellulosilyticus]GAE30104.1 3'-to-5' oligoribonuclease A [Halalkalibacter hemicellulosilyticusJCM 9152]